MKFSVNQSELAEALSVVIKGTSSKSTLTVLSGIYLKAESNTVVLQSTDLVLSIKVTISALIDEEGTTVIPGKVFLDIIKSLPDVAINIEVTDFTATISTNSSSFTFKTLNPEDFSLFPEINQEIEASFPYKTFASMVKSTSKIVSQDEAHPLMNGILITQEDSILKMVATDSFRLAVAESEIINPVQANFEVVISGKFLQEISSLPMSDENISIAVNENQVIITYRNMSFINRRIEGKYPNYKQLLNTNYKTQVKLNTKDLLSAIRRVSILGTKASPVQISIDADTQLLTLVSRAQDIGNAQEVIPCSVEGESVEIAFNYVYMIDGLNSINEEEVYLDLFGSRNPGIFHVDKKQKYLYLIMPVRI